MESLIENNIRQYPYAQQVYPQVWVGCDKAAQDRAFLKEAGIKSVVNCTKDLPFYYDPLLIKEMSDDEKHEYFISYYRVACSNNSSDEEIENFISGTCNIIKNIIPRRPVLIHCLDGEQRSCSFAVCWLCIFFGYTVVNAVRQVIKYRKGAFRSLYNDNGHEIIFKDGIEKICY